MSLSTPLLHPSLPILPSSSRGNFPVPPTRPQQGPQQPDPSQVAHTSPVISTAPFPRPPIAAASSGPQTATVVNDPEVRKAQVMADIHSLLKEKDKTTVAKMLRENPGLLDLIVQDSQFGSITSAKVARKAFFSSNDDELFLKIRVGNSDFCYGFTTITVELLARDGKTVTKRSIGKFEFIQEANGGKGGLYLVDGTLDFFEQDGETVTERHTGKFKWIQEANVGNGAMHLVDGTREFFAQDGKTVTKREKGRFEWIREACCMGFVEGTIEVFEQHGIEIAGPFREEGRFEWIRLVGYMGLPEVTIKVFAQDEVAVKDPSNGEFYFIQEAAGGNCKMDLVEGTREWFAEDGKTVMCLEKGKFEFIQEAAGFNCKMDLVKGTREWFAEDGKTVTKREKGRFEWIREAYGMRFVEGTIEVFAQDGITVTKREKGRFEWNPETCRMRLVEESRANPDPNVP